MQSRLPFHAHYAPIQPHREYDSVAGFAYTEQKPCKALRGLVHCYWRLEIPALQNTGLPYRIVTDGCIDLYFELTSNDRELAWASVMGTQREAVVIPVPGPAVIHGIRFYPTVFPVLAQVNASDLQGLEIDLEVIDRTLHQSLRRALRQRKAGQSIAEHLDRWLGTRLADFYRHADPRVVGALNSIIQTDGNAPLHRILDEPISQRQLRRLFHRQVGESPKTFARIGRFQSALRALLTDAPRDPTTGYFDQSHLIREFKSCYGATPSALKSR